MRRLHLAAIAVIGFSCPVLALSLASYRSAETSLSDAQIAFAYRYYDDAATPVVDANSGNLSARYDWLVDSPNLGLSLAAACDFALSGFIPTAWLGRATGTVRLYPWEENLFFLFGGVESAAARGLPHVGLDARAGLGVGRFTDVTPLAKAMEMTAWLVVSQAVPANLSDDVVLAVARLIERAGEYASMADLVRDIQAVVEFGAGVPLDARALLKIESIVSSRGRERRSGWAVQGGVGYELLDPYGEAQDAVYAGAADAALAAGPDDQFLFHASYSGPFAALDENTLIGAASYVLDFAPGASLSVGYTLTRVKPAGLAASVAQEASLGLAFAVSFGSLGLQVSVLQESGDPGWSIDVSMSAALDLL